MILLRSSSTPSLGRIEKRRDLTTSGTKWYETRASVALLYLLKHQTENVLQISMVDGQGSHVFLAGNTVTGPMRRLEEEIESQCFALMISALSPEMLGIKDSRPYYCGLLLGIESRNGINRYRRIGGLWNQVLDPELDLRQYPKSTVRLV